MSMRSWSSVERLQGDSKRNTLRSLNWFGLGLEVIGGIIVAITAIYLRVADLHPVTFNVNWKLICSDKTLTYDEPVGDNPILLYIITIIVPVVFILILEMEQTIFSESSNFNGMNKSERICKNLPRWGRILAMFVLGIFLASFFADYLKIVVVQPRPYFYTKFGGNCPSPYNGTDTAFYDALKSFPSHLATVASFCCMFAVVYAHNVREARNSSILVPIMSQGFLVLAVTASLDRYTSRFNHISDILGGFIIGLLLAVYMSALLTYQEKTFGSEEITDNNWMNFWSSFIPRARVSLPPTRAEARNVMDR